MKSPLPVFVLFLLSVLYVPCQGQNKTTPSKEGTIPVAQIDSPEFGSITRNIIQDRKGDIWITTFAGVFRYDGKAFTNMMSQVSTARFFSVLEDRKGNLWFGSIGSGVYLYDGKVFRNFTTRDGLVNNEVVSIYEDINGTIWFGANGGMSLYDGKAFRNYKMNGNTILEDRTGIPFPDFTRPPNEVNSIIEDKTGKLWLATRGNTYLYDGKTFTPVTNNGLTFTNVRTIIKDKKGNIWLGGQDGLWRYDGSTFTNITQDFVGYILEDKKGNIWTSSEAAQGWVLSRYEAESLTNTKPTVTEINPKEGRMLFGLLAANDGSIWFGADGVYRYDGKTVTDFRNK